MNIKGCAQKLAGLLLALSVITTGCKKESLDDSPFTLGFIFNLTGAQAPLDAPSVLGAKLAIDQVNAAGGIDGKALDYILRDGKTDQAVLRAEVRAVLRDYPVTAAFLGLSDSDQVLAAAEEAAGEGRVFLTSGATSPQLPGQIPDYLFLACFGDNVQAAAAAEWAFEERSVRSVAVVYDSTQTYTRLLQGYFRTRFEELGGRILSVKAYDQEDLSGIADGVQDADLVFLSAVPQSVQEGIQRLRLSGFTGPILGGDGFDFEDLWEEGGDLQDVFFTTPVYLGADHPDPDVHAFRNAYRKAFDSEEPSAFSALGFDAANLLIEARRLAGTNEPEAIRQALASIQNFEGVTGTISFEVNSRIPKKSVSILEVKGGKVALSAVLLPERVPAP